jgi:FkbM family methyltransferase
MTVGSYDNLLRWLYDHAPFARPAIRKQIRTIVGERDVTARGLKWRCHPRDNAVERALWLHGETDEDEEIDWLIGRLKPGNVFCDIGANCGFYSLTIRAATGARVIAIEPNPIMRGRLAENLRLNGINGITVEPCAVGESVSRMVLHMGSRWDYGQASLIDNAKDGVEVDVRPLADILQQHGKANALKIDIEGYEDRALGPFLTSAPEADLPSSLVIEHLHQKMWRMDLEALAMSRGYELVKRTANNLLLSR